MINRKEFWLNGNRGKVPTPCFREQMFFNILKIPTKKLIEIVTKYNLVRFPNDLKRYTLANVICDCTIEDVADKISGDES